MQLTSQAFAPNGQIPAKYTCKGENISPPLEIADVPAQAQSLTLIVHDPDAVSGDFTHWLVWNMSSQHTSIAEHSVPQGALEGTTDFGRSGYGGPCPPAGTGTHRYFFELYALDTTLALPVSANRAELEAAMAGHILARSELIGTYGQ